jgi:hypothetical protein
MGCRRCNPYPANDSARQDRTGPPSQRPVVVRPLGALALLCALSTPALASPCSVPLGHAVVLKSVDIDPDVFVWDAKQRVVDYAGGHWESRDVLAHTLLAKPGTRAVIVQCDPGAVRMKFAPEHRDAVGIKLMNGPNKGRYGWVTSEDVHEIARR